ncbi:MAG: hypothetical protein ACYDBB_08570 [Armatimonadota bacterium]
MTQQTVNTSTPMRMEYQIHFQRERAGRKVIKEGKAPEPVDRIPRIARLLALAHHFDRLIADGAAKDYADIARLAHLTRARVTQIMTLRYLAPEIQESIIHTQVGMGTNTLPERQIRDIALQLDWSEQRRHWQSIFGPI